MPAYSAFALSMPRLRVTARDHARPLVTHPPWRAELERTAWRYHVTGSWVAAVLNPLFAFNDHAVMPHRWTEFLVLRLVVSALIILTLLLRRWLHLSPEGALLVPYVLISLENAYMWSFMEADLFRVHALAYAVLFVGAGMIALWSFAWSALVAGISAAANVYFLQAHSTMPTALIMANGGTLLCAVVIIAGLLAHHRHRLACRELILRQQLKERTDEAIAQQAVIEAAHRDLTASIRYSQRIQQAVLPDTTVLAPHVRGHFVLHRPKDIVSGDFAWCAHVDGHTVWAAADCTGHGVPGALMSILGTTLLNTIVIDQGQRGPSAILDQLRTALGRSLGQRSEGPQDGMDIALCVLDHEAAVIRFAGAFNPLYLVRDGALTETPADRMPIGPHPGIPAAFTEQVVPIRPGDMVYVCSDGLQDQFGGPNDRKFGRSRLKDLFTRIAPLPPADQQRHLLAALDQWQQHRPSLDDVLVIGGRL